MNNVHSIPGHSRHAPDAKLLFERGPINDPVDVGHGASVVAHRTGHGEGRGLRNVFGHRTVLQKLFHNGFKCVILGRGECLQGEGSDAVLTWHL